MTTRPISAFIDWINDDCFGGWANDMSGNPDDLTVMFDDPLGPAMTTKANEPRTDLQLFRNGRCGFSFRPSRESMNEVWRRLAIGRRILPVRVEAGSGWVPAVLPTPFYKACIGSERIAQLRSVQDHGRVSSTAAGRLYVGRQDRNRTLDVFSGSERVPDDVVEHWINYIRVFGKMCEDVGTKFVFCIMPAKEVVEADALGLQPSDQRPVCRILDGLDQREAASVLYNVGALTREHYLRDVFQPDDTHVNGTGLVLTYRAVCERLGVPRENVLRQEDLVVSYELKKGDLSETAAKAGHHFAQTAHTRVRPIVENAQIEAMGHLYAYQDVNDYMEASEPGNPTSIFVVGRSPAVEMIPLIAKTFGTTFRNKGVYPDLAAFRRSKYSHALTIISERHLNSVLKPVFAF